MRFRPWLALLLLAPAGATGAPAPAEELYAFVSEGSAWHWVEVVLDAPAWLEARVGAAPRTARSVAGGLWLLDADGAVLRSSVDARWPHDLLQAHAAVAPLGVLADEAVHGSPMSPDVGFEGSLDAGRYTLVALFGGDGPLRGEVRVSADAPARVLGSRTGGGVVFLREERFDGSAAVLASAPTPAGPAQASVVLQASHGLVAAHSLFGAFAGASNGPLDMALVTPEGVQDGATFYPLDHAGAGAFQFLLRQFVDVSPPGCAGLPGCVRAGVWLLLADVALP